MGDFKTICERAKTLGELFDLWEEAHKAEENWESTAPELFHNCVPLEEFKGSFCPDGVTSVAGGVVDTGGTVDVLFLLKEAHLKGAPERAGTFWFNRAQDKCDDKQRGFYMRRLCMAMEKLHKDLNMKTFGYMNINKRGGDAATNHKQLKAYAEEYGDFIKREIELLHPKVILCCGCFDIAAKTLCLQEMNIAPRVIPIYHPRYSRFEKSLENIVGQN